MFLQHYKGFMDIKTNTYYRLALKKIMLVLALHHQISQSINGM